MGIVAACVLALSSGVVWLIALNPAEVARGAGLAVAFFASIYVLGYAVSKGIALTPIGRARVADAAKREADRQYEEAVPATMVVLNAAIDGRYEAKRCTLFGPETQLFPVGPGAATEIIEQAKAVSDEHFANTLCVYLVDNNQSVTYLCEIVGGRMDKGMGRRRLRGCRPSRKARGSQSKTTRTGRLLIAASRAGRYSCTARRFAT